MWYYLYDLATGRLLSEASDPPQPAVGQAVVSRATRADSSVMWDAVTAAFVARPPKVILDRIDDLNNDPNLSAVWTRLTVAQRTVLRNRLIALLGYRRFRGSGEPVDFGDRP